MWAIAFTLRIIKAFVKWRMEILILNNYNQFQTPTVFIKMIIAKNDILKAYRDYVNEFKIR